MSVKTSLGDLHASSVVVARASGHRLSSNVTSSPLRLISMAHTAIRDSRDHIHLPSCDGCSLTSNARDHDLCDGFGPYDHIPTLMEPLGTAIGKRLPDIFDQSLPKAFYATLNGARE